MNISLTVEQKQKVFEPMFKYFETEFEKDKFKRKLKFSKRIMIIEDSSDIYYGEGGLK